MKEENAIMTLIAEARIPFRLAGGEQPLILLPVQVNGQGPFEFILDTGAGPTLLANELADSLGVARGEAKEAMGAGGGLSVSLATLDSLTIGSERFEDVPVAITDLSAIAGAIRARVDGDLGHSVLRHFIVTLDYPSSTLILTRSPEGMSAPPSRPAEFVAFRLAHPQKPLIVVPVVVNDKGPYEFAVDTGASTSVVSSTLARELGLVTENIPSVTAGGGSVQAERSRLESVSVGGTRQQDLPVIVSDFLTMLNRVIGVQLEGIVGYNFLRNYRVTIDYPSALLSFE